MAESSRVRDRTFHSCLDSFARPVPAAAPAAVREILQKIFDHLGDDTEEEAHWKIACAACWDAEAGGKGNNARTAPNPLQRLNNKKTEEADFGIVYSIGSIGTAARTFLAAGRLPPTVWL